MIRIIFLILFILPVNQILFTSWCHKTSIERIYCLSTLEIFFYIPRIYYIKNIVVDSKTYSTLNEYIDNIPSRFPTIKSNMLHSILGTIHYLIYRIPDFTQFSCWVSHWFNYLRIIEWEELKVSFLALRNGQHTFHTTCLYLHKIC